MSNVHTPERQEGESQLEYRIRQKSSAALGRITQHGTPNTGRFVAHGNPQARMRRNEIKAAGGIRQFKRARSAALRAMNP